MKAIILAGGFGSRFGSRTETLPKPMIEIGGKPILWHIMKIYSYYGIKEFIICGGYKVEAIKDYFLHFNALNEDFTVDLAMNSIQYHPEDDEYDWKVTIADTGLNTLKGGRIKRIEKYIDDDINLLTYGDGLADINISELIDFHKTHGRILTMTGVKAFSQFGELEIENDFITNFKEKADLPGSIINGGYMVFNKEMFDYLSEDEKCDFEFDTIPHLAKEKKIVVYRHQGKWSCMDTERDKRYLNDLWEKNQAFWKLW